MRVRMLSSYPLVKGEDGRPVLPPNVVDLPDGLAKSLCDDGTAEPASDEDTTAEVTVDGWVEPEPSSDEPSPRRRSRS